MHQAEESPRWELADFIFDRLGPRARTALKIWAVWTLLGCVMAIQSHYRMALLGKGRPWYGVLFAELSYTWMWALLTPVVLFMARRFPLVRAVSWRIPGHLFTGITLAILTKTTWDFVVLVHLQPSMVPSSFNGWAASALGTMDYGLLQYGLILAWEHAAAHFQRAEETRLKASQLEAQLARAQLQALKMQLHPHFLFNTLHAISELIHADPSTAETMIVRLSDFLRLTLDHVGIPEVTLMQEVEFVKRYLEIEKMRFEDRLRIEMNLDTPTLYARVPNLVLQPLVENALRHGLARRTHDGLLSIRSSRENGHLTIRVFDNGANGAATLAKTAEAPIREGVGISNTRRRLQQIYGTDHSLEMSHQPGGGFEVTIRVPFRLSPQD